MLNMICKFNDYINESVKDLMVGKDVQSLRNSLMKLPLENRLIKLSEKDFSNIFTNQEIHDMMDNSGDELKESGKLIFSTKFNFLDIVKKLDLNRIHKGIVEHALKNVAHNDNLEMFKYIINTLNMNMLYYRILEIAIYNNGSKIIDYILNLISKNPTNDTMSTFWNGLSVAIVCNNIEFVKKFINCDIKGYKLILNSHVSRAYGRNKDIAKLLYNHPKFDSNDISDVDKMFYEDIKE